MPKKVMLQQVDMNPADLAKKLFQAKYLPLNELARAITNQGGHKGTVIITVTEKGFQMGASGLSNVEIQETLEANINFKT